MREILNFLIEVGKLKGKKRRGWEIHKIKNAETTAEHIFHLAFLVWILGENKRMNMERAIKMALVHDICEIYSPDFTSYDAVAIKGKKRLTIKEVLNLKPESGRPSKDQRMELERVKKILEAKAMNKLTAHLPPALRREMKNLWLDYENGVSREGRFVKQADKTINLMQGLAYWKKYGRIPYRLWVRRIKEVLDDPVLVAFMRTLEKKFCSK